ncbi:hypothetical protein F8271_00845 [Micromonospora sp. ALFpr18c]|nr:hypothetical protein F8271_00845 [Micromonospora sp. ALFpr18c]
MPTARSAPCCPRPRSTATRARPTRPTGQPPARTTARAPPPAPTRAPTDRPGGPRTLPPHDGCVECAGSHPDEASHRRVPPPDHHRTRSPEDDQRAHDGGDCPRPLPRPVPPPPRRRAGGRRTPAPADGRASTPGCGPIPARHRSPVAPANWSR